MADVGLITYSRKLKEAGEKRETGDCSHLRKRTYVQLPYVHFVPTTRRLSKD